eukprot:scaffold71942_cov24-Tisochrysis_lutea.AAC.4
MGMGDARILRVRNFAAEWVTEAQYPLRATPPLVATRPISLEAAYIGPTGGYGGEQVTLLGMANGFPLFKVT